jgi:hypothetical protein
MKLFTKIAIRIVLLIAIFLALNEIYKCTFYKEDLLKYGDLLDSLHKVVDDSDVLYFAESSNFSYLPDEPNQKSISALVQDFLPGISVNAVNKGALHAKIYHSLLQNIPADAPVKAVVITLNLRSFNADWINSELETQLMQQNVILQTYPPIVKRFMLAFKAYDDKTVDERNALIQKSWRNRQLVFPYEAQYTTTYAWDIALANGSFLLEDGNWDMPKIQLATAYVKSYAFQIDTNSNPRIKDFDAIARYASERGWKLVFNLLADNTQKAQELVGDDLVFLMRQNKDILVERYSRKGAIVVDNLEVVASEDYIDQNWTTEHYNARGRTLIAYNVARAIERLWPEVAFNDFRNLPSLFNDFEGSAKWKASGEKSSEKSWSGTYSFKLIDENPYSETLEVQVGQLFSALPKQLTLRWKVFSTKKSDEPRMVVDILRNGQSVSWQGFSLLKYESENTWVENAAEVILPSDLHLTDVIKIYAWNPSKSPVYIDDIEIEAKPSSLPQ